ncbi:MAG: PAS domain S-box protein [Holophagaceae bacterium]|nr:PAS domain S-box protein [Holophagaceae bacterium]
MASQPRNRWQESSGLLLLTGGLLLGITLGTYRHIQAERREARSLAAAGLAAIGDLKASQIVQWRREHLADARHFNRPHGFADLVRRGLAPRPDPQALKALENWLGEYVAQNQADAARLLDAQGRERLAVPAGRPPMSASARQEAMAALAGGEPTFRDFYRSPEDGRIYLGLFIPVPDAERPGRFLGLLNLRIDPSRSLYPFILHWPTPSPSAETLLVRREGDQAVYLSELRFQPGAALTSMAGKERGDYPAAQAVRGAQGIIEGLDYRGVPVLADLRPIPGSPWFLVNRIDQAEVFADFQRNLLGSLLLGAALVLATLAGSALIWREKRALQARRQYESERESAWLRDAIARSQDEVYVIEIDTLRFRFVSAGACRNLAYSPSELLEMSPSVIGFSRPDEDFQALAKRVVESGGEPLSYQATHRRKNGTAYPVEVQLQRVDHHGESVLLAVARDITESKRAEEALRESLLNYRNLADSGQALIWTSGLDKGCTYFNEPWLRFTGRSLEQELGNGWAEGVHPEDFERCLQTYVAAFDRREPFSMEYRLRHASGEYRWLLDDGTPNLDARGNFLGYIGYCLDITDRKRAEQEVERLNALVKESQSIAQVGGWEIDLPSNTLSWTEETYRIHETSPLEYTPTVESAIAFYAPESLPLIQQAVLAAIEQGLPFDLELEVITARGRRITVHTTSRPIQQEGRTIKVVGAFQDITAQKEAERSLREAKTRLKLAIEAGRMGVWDWDLQDGSMVWDERMFQLYGITGADFTGVVKDWQERVHPADAGRALEDCAAALRGERPFSTEFRILGPDGTIRWIRAAGQVLQGQDGQPVRMTGVNWDITEQKRDAEALELAHFALEHLSDPVYWLRKDASIADANQSALLELGYTREELLGLKLSDIDVNYSEAFWAEHWPEMCRLGSMMLPSRHRRKDGSEFQVEISINHIRFGDQELLCGFARNVAEREQAEEQLRRSEAMLRSVIDASPVPFALSEGSGEITYLNPTFIRSFGYDLQDLPTLAHWWTEAYPDPEYRGWVMDHWQKRLNRSEREGTRFENLEVKVRCKDGSDRTILSSVAPLTGSFRGTHLLVFYDITERRQMELEHSSLENQFNHLQRLESVGRLAGGIAHDMNNVLASIMAVANLIHFRGGEDAERAALILDASKRGRNLVKGLMEFARREIQDAEFVDLNETVAKEAELLASTTLKRIEFKLDLSPKLPRLMGSVTAISTALMNLCVNAIDAMPEGGTITLRTSQIEEGVLELEVSDTGHGMPPEVLSRAMEPFYTTKPLGKGTGLGLSMVFGMVQAHNGTIDIQSQVGAGTQVRIHLPIIPSEKRGLARAVPAPAHALPPPLRILLVDDDRLVRKSTVEMLTALGHQLSAVSGGEEALAFLRHGPAWDVVILDQNMPEMNGLETLRRLRSLQPELPVVVATGFADEQLRGSLASIPKVVLLPKPYSINEIQGCFSDVSLGLQAPSSQGLGNRP